MDDARAVRLAPAAEWRKEPRPGRRRPPNASGGDRQGTVIGRRDRRRRDGATYTVFRVRWWDEARKKRCRTFDRERDARDFEAKVRIAPARR